MSNCGGTAAVEGGVGGGTDPFTAARPSTPRYGLVTDVGTVGRVAPADQHRFTTLFVAAEFAIGGRAPIAELAVAGTRLFTYGSPVSPALLTGLVAGFGIASGGWNRRRTGIGGGSRNGVVPAPVAAGVLWARSLPESR